MIAIVLTALLAQEPATAEVKTEADAAPAVETPLLACQKWKSPGLMEGPAFIGYADADFAIGRRACPRSEIGIGVDFGAIIDTPNFYGDVGIQALIYGSWALNDKTEIFALLEAYDWQYTVNAVISGTRATLGHATLGISRQVYQTDDVAGAFSLRVLLPTHSGIPGNRITGAEVGHSVSMRAMSWLEMHAYAGLGFTVGLGPASLPALTVAGMVGAALSPTSWFSLVVDVAGGIAGRSFLAPSAALRFRVFNLGIEIAVTRPFWGDDRHDAIGAVRFAWRI